MPKTKPAFYVIVQHFVPDFESNAMLWFGNFCLLLRIEQMANKTKTNHLNKSIIIQFCAQDTSPGISMRFVFVHNCCKSLDRQRKMSCCFFWGKFGRKSMMTWNEISRWENFHFIFARKQQYFSELMRPFDCLSCKLKKVLPFIFDFRERGAWFSPKSCSIHFKIEIKATKINLLCFGVKVDWTSCMDRALAYIMHYTVWNEMRVH